MKIAPAYATSSTKLPSAQSQVAARVIPEKMGLNGPETSFVCKGENALSFYRAAYDLLKLNHAMGLPFARGIA